jgi:hypothetical protein
VPVEPRHRALRRSWPSTPAPGLLEAAVGLVLVQAHPVRPEAWAVLTAHLLGVDGGAPVSLAQAAASVGRPAWWVRELLPRVRMVARHAGPPASLLAAVRVLEDGPVRTAGEASAALVAAGACAGPVHPGGVLRAAEVLGAGCAAQLLTAAPGGPGGPAEGVADAGDARDTGDTGGRVDLAGARAVEEVVAPAGRAPLVRAVMAAVVAAERRGDVVDLAEAAATVGSAGVPVGAVRLVVGRQPGWQVHHHRGGAGDGPGAAHGRGAIGASSWWAWRRPLVRKRGLVTSVAVRLLAARAYEAGELHAAVVDVVERLSPATRRDAGVPPAAVLVAWLTAQGLLEPAAAGGLLRCPADLALGSDVVLLQAVTAAGGTVEVAGLAEALRAAGYSASTSTQLARTCPVLTRVGRGRYAAR